MKSPSSRRKGTPNPQVLSKVAPETIYVASLSLDSLFAHPFVTRLSGFVLLSFLAAGCSYNATAVPDAPHSGSASENDSGGILALPAYDGGVVADCACCLGSECVIAGGPAPACPSWLKAGPGPEARDEVCMCAQGGVFRVECTE
jgi:hypothetical protein